MFIGDIFNKKQVNEGLREGEYYLYKVYFDDGTSSDIAVTSDEFDFKSHYAKKGKNVVKVERQGGIRSDFEEGVAEGELEEYGDTARGQKQLTRVHKRAVNRIIKADNKNRLEPDYTKRDLKTVRKNQDTADRAWERFTGMDLDEGVEGIDSVELDIPLLIRLLEYAREDAQSDMDLHNVTEKLIALSQQGGRLSMDDYDTVVGKISEAFKMPKQTAAEKLYKHHQKLRQKSGLPHPDYYKELHATYDLPDEERYAKAAELKKKYGLAEAKWRHPKYKDKLYTQADTDDGSSADYDYYYYDNPRPKDQPFTGRKEIVGTNPWDKSGDVLDRGFGTGNTGGGQWQGKTSPSPYKDSEVAKQGSRKGLLKKGAISRTKNDIRNRMSHYKTKPNLPEGVAEGEHPKTWHDVDPKLGKQVDKMSQAEKVSKGFAHSDTLKKKTSFIQKLDAKLQQLGYTPTQEGNVYRWTSPTRQFVEVEPNTEDPGWYGWAEGQVTKSGKLNYGDSGNDSAKDIVAIFKSGGVFRKQGVAEGGPFSYGAKKPRKGSVADLAAKKRQEQEKGKQPVEPRDHMVGTARVKQGVAEGSDNITAVFSGYGNYMKGRGANVFKHYGITVLDKQYDEDEDIVEYTVSGSKEALNQARAYLERSDQFGGMIIKQGVAEGRFDEPLTGWHIVSRAHGQVVRGTPSFETKDQAQKYLMTRMFANHHEFKVVHTAGVAEDFSDDLDDIYALHPGQEESESVAIKITDVDLGDFDDLWAALPMPYLNEFGGDLPLWDTEDLKMYPNMKVKAMTFDQYVKLVGNYINSDDIANTALTKMKKGVAEVTNEDVEKYLEEMQRAGYDIVNEKKDRSPGKITKSEDPCWSGYHMVGKKKKNGRTVPNCVPGKKG